MNQKHDSSSARSANTPGVTTAELLAKQVIPVLVKPGASKTEILGIRDGYLHIALKAAPIEGKANEELLKFLKRKIGKRYELISGVSARKKLLKCMFP